MEVYVVTRTEYDRYENNTTVDAVFTSEENAKAYCNKMTAMQGKYRHAPTYDYEGHPVYDVHPIMNV